MPSYLIRRALLALAWATPLAAPAAAQSDSSKHGTYPLTVVGSTAEEWLRLSQLRGDAPTSGFLLRSPSALVVPATGSSVLVLPLLPHVQTAYNSGIAHSMNDGALWAGRGASMLVRAGLVGAWRNVRLVLAPELVRSANLHYGLADSSIYPTVHPEISKFASPWFYELGRMDFPLRMGDRPLTRLLPGQSSATITTGSVAFGVATENHWWGPGTWNAMILSNNAPGFGHAFLRTSRPVRTRIGDVEARWIIGGLEESDFYDFDPANDLRSISLLGVTLRPWWDRNLTLGAARAVYSVADGWGDVAADAWQVLADVGTPNAHPWRDTASYRGGRDQLFSLFFRYAFSGSGGSIGDGVEVYGEWGRMEQPRSLRDFLVEPNHTQAYIVGTQWLGARVWNRGQFRVRGELAHFEMSPTYRTRPTGTWYASRSVEQGYTHRGQSLGAAIGPGSSSQHLAAGFVGDGWYVEGLATRIRWQNDVQAERINYPSGGWCEHDVTLAAGMRTSLRSRIGSIAVSYLGGTRYNPFFSPRQPSCPGDNIGDIRNNSLTVRLEPAAF